MVAATGLSLTRVTVATDGRRLDVAVPGDVTVGELLPHLLRHAGGELADTGETHGGWALRRGPGATLDDSRTLSTQEVRDGEVLYLVPRRADWPEPAYDDVVDLIAADARRAARSWDGAATRLCTLTVTALVLTLGSILLAWSGPPWRVPGAVALAVALVAELTGVLVSRSFGDAGAGAVPAACALPYAFIGGLLAAEPKTTTGGFAFPPVTAHDLLLGASALVLFSVVGYVGVAAGTSMFTAGTATGLFAAGGAALTVAGVSPAGAAAIVLALAIGLLPGYPLTAAWLGRLPMPELPDRPEAIVQDQPLPARADVFATVVRATDLLSGLLLAAATTSLAAMIALVDAGPGARWLCAAGCVALLLRGRFFPSPVQRIPLLAAGGAGLAAVLLAIARTTHDQAGRLGQFAAVAVVAAVVLASGLVYSRRRPTPRVGRVADLVDVAAVVALVPLACAVLGVYQAVRDVFAGIGG
ncbi:type VII secretion integral membrane protein EccD [Catenulispora sp. GAS73]|uniref:type VII secretion integral membrane protein EccD n=1 Tax=Catenulispora sp. GAS73 TaxID=3156269 RepID=UPI003513B61A